MRFSIGIVILIYLSIWSLLAQTPLSHEYVIWSRTEDVLEARPPERSLLPYANLSSRSVPGFSRSRVSIRGLEMDSEGRSKTTESAE